MPETVERTPRSQRQWEWPIAAYLYLAGVGAGAFAVGVLTEWLASPELPSKAMLLWGPLVVAFGAPFLILDLGKKTKFINASLNPQSSWAARGFAILTSLIVIGLTTFGLALLPDILPLFGLAPLPGFITRLAVTRTLEAIALGLSIGTVAYTGVFLKSVRYVSLWNTWLLPLLFSTSAMSTGAMALIGFLLATGLGIGNTNAVELSRILIPAELLLLVLELLALAWLLTSLRRAGQASKRTIRHLAIKSSPGLALALVLLLGAYFVPPDWRAPVSSPYAFLVFAAGVLVLTGGFLLRYDVVKLGAKDLHPLHKMVDLQYNWKALVQAPVSQQGAMGTRNQE